MTTYYHADLPQLSARLRDHGFKERRGTDFTRVWARGAARVVVDLPTGEVYETVTVHLDFPSSALFRGHLGLIGG